MPNVVLIGTIAAVVFLHTGGCTRIEVHNDVDEPVCDVVVTSGAASFPIGRLEPGATWGTTQLSEDAYSGTLCARRCSAAGRVCAGVNVTLLEFHASQAWIAPGPASGVLQGQTLYLDGSGPGHIPED